MVTINEANSNEFKLKQHRQLCRLRYNIETKSYAWVDQKVNMINVVGKTIKQLVGVK